MHAVREFKLTGYPVNTLPVGMKVIKTGLKLYHKEYQQACYYPCCQTCNVNKRVNLVTANISPRSLEIIFEHGNGFQMRYYSSRTGVRSQMISWAFIFQIV